MAYMRELPFKREIGAWAERNGYIQMPEWYKDELLADNAVRAAAGDLTEGVKFYMSFGFSKGEARKHDDEELPHLLQTVLTPTGFAEYMCLMDSDGGREAMEVVHGSFRNDWKSERVTRQERKAQAVGNVYIITDTGEAVISPKNCDYFLYGEHLAKADPLYQLFQDPDNRADVSTVVLHRLGFPLKGGKVQPLPNTEESRKMILDNIAAIISGSIPG